MDKCMSSIAKEKNKIDMLNGKVAGKIFMVALPLAAISILQQLFNAADVAVVGRFATDDAIAAVGANSSIINMFLTFFTGVSTGGNVAISTLIGQGKKDKINDAVHTVFTMSLIAAVFIVVVGEIIARPLLVMTSTPANILDSALLYLRIYFGAMAFGVIFNFCSAILRSKGDTKRPLICLVASGIINILLNLLFVIVFKMDVAGVAIATLISNGLCAVATVIMLLREDDNMKLSLHRLRICKDPLLFAVRVGLPAGIQGMLFSISNVIIQAAINTFGSDCIAGNTTTLNFEFISYFVVNAFTQTATTFISQNYGARQFDRCKKILRLCWVFAVTLCLAVSSLFYFGSDFWIGLFTDSPAVIEFAKTRMMVVVMMEFMTANYEMTAASLRAMDVAIPPTIITIIGSCVLRIVWVNTIFAAFHQYWVLILVYPVSWALLMVPMLILYIFVSKKKMR